MTLVPGPLPMTVEVAEPIALVIGKERTNALFTKVGGSITPRSRANGRISQLKPTLSSIVSIVPVTSL